MKTLRQTLTCFCLALLLSASAWAQFTTGSMSGTATDVNNAALAGAKLSLKQNSTARVFNTVTTSEGLYAYPNLDPFVYALTVEQNGFTKRIKLYPHKIR